MVDEAVLLRVLAAALKTGGGFAEVFIEERGTSSARLDNGRVQEFLSASDHGAGIRVIAGETSAFAHTSDVSESGLRDAAEAAATAARSTGAPVCFVDLSTQEVPSGAFGVTLEAVSNATKLAFLQRADSAARSTHGDIRRVATRYSEERRSILVANSDGVRTGDDSVRTLVGVQAVAARGGEVQTGYESAGFTTGWDVIKALDIEQLARVASHRAVVKLGAAAAPSEALPVVLARGSGGVLFHEACGHGLEADVVMKGGSVYGGRIGEVVASPLVTVVDNARMPSMWGSYSIDDEGHRADCTVLIEDGVLTDYMWDLERARKANRRSSGNGRRQSYRHLPMVRMTNTFLGNGSEDPFAIIRDTARGVYVVKLAGGQVNTTTGDFEFGTAEAYMIEHGAVTHPIRDAHLIGNGPDVLKSIDVIGNDLGMGWPGTCGKDGQEVPVGHGNPTLRVAHVTVAGGLSRSSA